MDAQTSTDTPCFQTGETRYGKPIIERLITAATPIANAAKCVLVSFDATMRSNLSVGMPIDMLFYQRDSLQVGVRRRFDDGDEYLKSMSRAWSEGIRQVFREWRCWTGK